MCTYTKLIGFYLFCRSEKQVNAKFYRLYYSKSFSLSDISAALSTEQEMHAATKKAAEVELLSEQQKHADTSMKLEKEMRMLSECQVLAILSIQRSNKFGWYSGFATYWDQ